MSVETQIIVTGNIGFFGGLVKWWNEFVIATPIGTVLQVLAALIVAMILVGFVKSGVKIFWVVKTSRQKQIRQFVWGMAAYIAGFQAARYFITDVGKLAALIGFINPIIYIGICRWAYATERYWILAVFKGRKLKRDADGKLSLGETR